MPTQQVDFHEAHYQCVACNHLWVSAPGAVVCPRCNQLYVRWINYEACAAAYHEIPGHSSIEINAFGGYPNH